MVTQETCTHLPISNGRDAVPLSIVYRLVMLDNNSTSCIPEIKGHLDLSANNLYGDEIGVSFILPVRVVKQQAVALGRGKLESDVVKLALL